MTIALTAAALYTAAIVANCIFFRNVHRRDEQIDGMYTTRFAAPTPVRYQKTGS